MTENIQKKTLSPSQQAHTRPFTSFLVRNEFLIPLALFLVFLAVTLPGISWGAPNVWHPDEIVVRSIKALHGEWKFSETNFDYPDLPQYTMYWLGKLVLALGYGDSQILVTARVLSAVLPPARRAIRYVSTTTNPASTAERTLAVTRTWLSPYPRASTSFPSQYMAYCGRSG